jgi:DJ-1/PfpI family protein/beta-propeller uncharacterized protein DUF5122
MKFRFFIFLIFYLATTTTLTSQSNFKVLCILPDKLGANFNLNMDHFEHFGWEVTTSGVTQTINTCNWSVPGGNLPVEADTLISDIESFDNWDVIAIMPASWRSGEAYGDLIYNTHFLNLLEQANQQNKIIWATCAGVRVLAFADIINGVNITGKSYFQSEYIQAEANYLGGNILPVIDGNIVTSTRGMYYQYQNINAIINAHSSLSKKNNTGRNSQFSKTHHRPNDSLSSGFRQMALTNENNFTYCGYQYDGENNCNILIKKMDKNGDEIWSKIWDNSNWDYATSIFRTQNNNLLVTGFTTQPDEQQNIVALNYGDNGDLIWQSIIGGEKPETGNAIIKASNGKIYICGHTESYGNGEDDVYLVCLESDGSFLWHHTYGGVASDMGKDIIESQDGNLLILGNTGSFGAGNRDIYLLKVDFNGTQIWTKTFGTADYQDASSLIEISDKSILIAGQTDILNVDLMDAAVIKTDSAGNEIWNHHYEAFDDFYDFGKDIIELPHGDYMVTGYTKHIERRINRGFAFIINQNGDELWKNEYGNDESNWIYSLLSFDENNIHFCGHKKYEPQSPYVPWVFSINNPITNISSNLFEQNNLLSLSPNPFNDRIYINVNDFDFENADIRIIDLAGKCIRSYTNLSLSDLPICWDGKNQYGIQVKAGTYIILFTSGSLHAKSKVIFSNDLF